MLKHIHNYHKKEFGKNNGKEDVLLKLGIFEKEIQTNRSSLNINVHNS